jgi:hypothetical protein
MRREGSDSTFNKGEVRVVFHILSVLSFCANRPTEKNIYVRIGTYKTLLSLAVNGSPSVSVRFKMNSSWER